MKKTLYMVRHGETLFNIKKKKQGWCDSPLSEKGKEQARKAHDYFVKHQIVFDHAYASTSERACDTLELITQQPYERLKGLKECNFGIFEGENEDLSMQHPFGDFYVPYGGEGEDALRQRICQTVREVMEKEDHQSVLMVSHGVAIAQLLEETGVINRTSRLANCGILVFAYENKTWEFTDYIDPNQ